MGRKLLFGAVTSVCTMMFSALASADVVAADYDAEFNLTTNPELRNGWSYLWNASGPLGNPLNYASLAVENGQYEPAGAPAGANALGIGSAPVDPLKFPQNPPSDPFGLGLVLPPLPSTYVRPGAGSTQDANGVERAGIVAYTFSAEEIAAATNGGTSADAFITDYYFAVSSTTTDFMTARVYKGNSATASQDYLFTPGFAFQTALNPAPIPLGNFIAGETLYIAIGSSMADGGDEMRLDLTLSLVPEPTTLSLLALTGLALLPRARRSRV